MQMDVVKNVKFTMCGRTTGTAAVRLLCMPYFIRYRGYSSAAGFVQILLIRETPAVRELNRTRVSLYS